MLCFVYAGYIVEMFGRDIWLVGNWEYRLGGVVEGGEGEGGLNILFFFFDWRNSEFRL